MIFLFWLSLFLVGYTYVGYPVLLRLLVAGKRFRDRRRVAKRLGTTKKKGTAATVEPERDAGPKTVSVVLVVYNEANRIEARIDNLAQCDRPWETEIVVVCDGCNDDTAERARAAGGLVTVRVFEQPERLGKASGLNRGVAEATGDVIVFADARQQFNRYAMLRLIGPFRDPSVAAVSGNLDIAPSDQGTGAGIDAYWKLERFIRRLESDLDSVIGCTGAIYAIRRDAFEPLPADTILDDVVIPMRVLLGGRRVLFASDAMAFDPQELAPEKEKRRKIRTLAGNYQMLFRYPEWLSPRRNRAWWQLISHKYLRLAGPLFLAICLATSAWLARDSVLFRFALGGQLGCYVLALLGLVFRAIRSPIFTAPAGFVFLQWQGLRALFHYLRLRRSTQSGAWS